MRHVEAHLHIVHDDVFVPGPPQGAAIVTELEEAPFLGSLGGGFALHQPYPNSVSDPTHLCCAQPEVEATPEEVRMLAWFSHDDSSKRHTLCLCCTESCRKSAGVVTSRSSCGH